MKMTTRDQMTFKGLHDCKNFEPNKFKRIRCANCGHDLDEHHSESVSDEHIFLFIEAQEKNLPASYANIQGKNRKK